MEEAIAFTGLSDFRKMRPKKLSGGLLRRLNIACGIVHKPRLIIMDEPTVAVDPQSRNKILEGILELNRQGSTCLLYTSVTITMPSTGRDWNTVSGTSPVPGGMSTKR